jgi:hypothetical protein
MRHYLVLHCNSENLGLLYHNQDEIFNLVVGSLLINAGRAKTREKQIVDRIGDQGNQAQHGDAV